MRSLNFVNVFSAATRTASWPVRPPGRSATARLTIVSGWTFDTSSPYRRDADIIESFRAGNLACGLSVICSVIYIDVSGDNWDVVVMPFRPMSSRALATAFADLADILAAERDVSATLRRLCRYCVDLLDVAAAGVLLAEKGQWSVAAASNERTHLLLRQSEDAGPCEECLRTGAPVLIPDVAGRAEVWPSFVGEARDQGFASAYTLPMRLRAVTQGILGLFSTRTDSLSNYRIQIAQALADAIMAGIMQQWALRQADTRAGQLQEALDSRVVIEQAKGVLSQRGDIEVDQAFLLLRRYARSHNQSLHQLARRLVGDRTVADDVLHDPHP